MMVKQFMRIRLHINHQLERCRLVWKANNRKGFVLSTAGNQRGLAMKSLILSISSAVILVASTAAVAAPGMQAHTGPLAARFGMVSS